MTPAELDRAYSAHSTLTLTSVHPYAAFDLADDLTLWGRRATAAARWRRSNRTCAGAELEQAGTHLRGFRYPVRT